MKLLLISLALLVPGAALGEASIPKNPQTPTFLLEAPGTVSGMGKPQSGSLNEYIPDPRSFVTPGYESSNNGQYHFPQYGQKPARANPWMEMLPSGQRPGSQMPPSTRPAEAGRMQEFQNPWDLRNLPDLGPDRFGRSDAFSSQGSAPGYGFPLDSMGSNNRYLPGLSDPMMGNSGLPGPMGFPYTGMPYMNGMLPGLGRDDSDFPFMPFDLF